MKMIPTLAAAAAAMPLMTHADVYRCLRNGQLVYTDQPCSAQAQPADLPKLQTVPAAPAEKGMAAAFDRRTDAAAAARDKADAAWLKKYRAEKARKATIRKGLIEDRVVVGMTPDQVEQVLHQMPDRVSGDPQHPKRWVFRSGRRRSTTVSFRDGRVSKVSVRGGDDE